MIEVLIHQSVKRTIISLKTFIPNGSHRSNLS
jgi:hypothetical protein